MGFVKNISDVTFYGKDTIFIDDSVKIGKGVIIYPNNIIRGNTVIEDNVIILSSNHIVDSHIGEGASIEFSHIEKSTIGKFTKIGPFARIRPNSIVGDNVKIGNFVEVKNATIGEGTKASHLSYIGDVDIGKNCNIGCGAIFVNYNGKTKARSEVGDGCFIGSNANIIAPVSIAEKCYICAGSTLTKNTRPGDFVIARTRETIKSQYAINYLKNIGD